MISRFRRTTNNRPVAMLRLLVGFIFVMAGVLKVVVPHLGDAFAGQLAAASIPFHELSFIVVPAVEVLVGISLILGWHARLSALVGSIVMLVATHVHLVADDPSLFPLQPVEPIGPLMLLAGLLYILFKGAGAWSADVSKYSANAQLRL